MKITRLPFTLFALLCLVSSCGSNETSLQSDIKRVDRAVFQMSGQDVAQNPKFITQQDTLAKLKDIVFGEASPVMKCATDAELRFFAGQDTILDLSLTLQEGCLTATFIEKDQLKSVWLTPETAAILTQWQQIAQGQSGLGELKWLLGKWTQTDPDGSVSFEEWRKGPRGGFVGHAFTMQGKDTVFQESLELIEEDGNIYYVATVQENAGPVKFKLTEHDATNATFENKAHDFPQIITYKAKGDSGIVATISGTRNGQFGRSEFPLKRVRE